MYVYIMKFANYPNLIKIGKSVTPELRARTLESSHGNLLSLDYYPIGKDCFDVESHLHKSFAEQRQKNILGDGKTEFFDDLVADKAKDYLKAYALNVDQDYIFEMIGAEIEEEKSRYQHLIGALLGYKVGKHRDNYPMFTGYFDCMNLETCVEFGYDLEDVSKRFISKEKQHGRLYRFTTPKRVAMAYNLYKYGSSKLKSLKALLETKRLPSLNVKHVADLQLAT